MKGTMLVYGIAGVATLLWNGHVFSNWDSSSSTAAICAVITTVAWGFLFVWKFSKE